MVQMLAEGQVILTDITEVPYTLSVKLSDFTARHHT
jgi:hypothetical protein